MRGKLSIYLFMLMGILVLFLSACNGGEAEESGTNSDSETEAGTINIGFVGPLSGGSATMGIPAQNGMELAVEEINDAGGINGKMIELMARDDEADPAKSTTIAQQLSTEEEIVAVLGGPNSGPALANSEVFAKYEIPNMISIAQNDNLLDPEKSSFATTFAMSENNTYDVRAIVEFMKSQGYENIGVIVDDSAYGQGALESIETVLDEEGIGIIEKVEHPVGAQSLSSQALKLKNAEGIDAVYVVTLGNDAALFVKTADQVGLDLPILGGRGLNMSSFIDLAGDATEGVILPTIMDPDKPEAQAYIQAYDAKYGEDNDPAHVFSVLGYDAVKLLAEGLKITEGKGGVELAEALETITDFETVSGGIDHTASYSPDKHVAPNENFIIFNTVKDGEFVKVE
ncbi:ABC transporter substrate-binding protein [Aquibacillus saliphilus]|uniref:ABC transporter substrate-binding protein n=1 Tax=Aquibacillus saliphilus TaxID=1909422 RepID=UPI001CF08C46|nr:ABC transporter substrate-binding protein [Aquibacillus saliphilus]